MAFRILLIRKPQQRKDNLNGIRNRFVHVAKLVRYLDSSKYIDNIGKFLYNEGKNCRKGGIVIAQGIYQSKRAC